jgi:hypothetical protein
MTLSFGGGYRNKRAKSPWEENAMFPGFASLQTVAGPALLRNRKAPKIIGIQRLRRLNTR